VAADARRYVQAAAGGYDVIVSDLFHPARSGAGSLYTVEHFAAVRDRLRPGGLFCQWLALHQMDLATLRSIVAAYLQVYPDAVAVLASNSLDTPVIGLVATAGRSQWQAEAIERRLAASPPALAGALRAARLQDAYAVLGSVLAGPGALQRFSAAALPNSDDQPVVAYGAPWATYAPEAAPRARLAALLDELQPDAADVLGQRGRAADRIAAYWQARADYLRLGLTVRPQADAHAMLLQLRGPLLGVLARSPDFRPAAEPLEALAQAVRANDPALAAQVLHDVQRLRAPSLLSP
jgi:spermidine synthase